MSPSLKKGIRWALSAAILVFLVYFATKINWHEAWNSMRATVAGAGLNNVLVASGGDAARVVFVSRASGVPSSTVLASMAMEKLFDPIGFVILLVYGVLAFQLPPQFERWKVPAEILLVVIVLLLAFFVYATRHIKPEHVP